MNPFVVLLCLSMDRVDQNVAPILVAYKRSCLRVRRWNWIQTYCMCGYNVMFSRHIAEVTLRRLKKREFSITNWVDNLNWSQKRVSKLTFRMLALRQSEDIMLWRRASARSFSFETSYGGQFTLSTQFIILSYPFILYHRRSTAVSLETYTL